MDAVGAGMEWTKLVQVLQKPLFNEEGFQQLGAEVGYTSGESPGGAEIGAAEAPLGRRRLEAQI